MTLALLGSAGLLAGLVLAGFSALVSGYAVATRTAVLAAVGRRAFYAAGASLAIASGALMAALLTHDFALAFVAEHSDASTGGLLLASTFYGGQEGSLLYWALALALLGGAALAGASRLDARAAAVSTGILATVLAFFLVVLCFVASPFDLLAVTPRDGLGLNPILRDGGMLVHPPFLLAGFASFAVPFALGMGALADGGSAGWSALTRRWALVSWGLQSVGLTLGMWWAYHVLGWGGYWGWDPVENVALLPWLAATAYVHSSFVEKKRAGLRSWNLGLLTLAFLLAVFGTFIVRSGVIQSVHTFAVSAIGPWFFGFLAFAVVASLAALAARGAVLAGTFRVQQAVSREGAYLFNNILLVAVCAAILWGTVLPLVSGLLTGQEAVVGPDYYRRVAAPCFLALVALMAVGPLIPWGGAARPRPAMVRTPIAAALVAAAAILALGARDPGPPLAGAVIAAAAATTLSKLVAGGPRALRAGLGRRRHHYGSFLAHLGLALLAAGIAGSQLGHRQEAVVLRPGQAADLAGYHLVYRGATATVLDHGHVRTTAELSLGSETLQPARTSYPDFGGQSDAQVAIRSTPLNDLYVVLGGVNPDGSAVLLVVVNPLVTWIWAGAALLVGGVLFGNLPWPAQVRAPEPEPARARVAALEG